MPRHVKHEDETIPRDGVARDRADREQSAGQDAPRQPTEPPPAMQAENTALRTENEALKDRLLRTLAESENARRRIERAAEDQRKYAIADFARRLLTVADTLERASGIATSTATGDATGTAAVAAGIEATARMLAATLEQAGVRRIEAQGAKFDPTIHEAVAELDAADKEPGSVAAVAEEGYTIHDRLLRPARVVVVKGRPSPGHHSH